MLFAVRGERVWWSCRVWSFRLRNLLSFALVGLFSSSVRSFFCFFCAGFFCFFFVFFFCRLLVHAAAVYNSRWPEAHKLSVRSRKKRTDFGSRVTLWSTPVLGSPSIAVTPWLAWHVPPPRPAHSATSQRHPPWRMCCPLRYVDAPMPCHVEIISHSLLRFLSFTAKNVIY